MMPFVIVVHEKKMCNRNHWFCTIYGDPTICLILILIEDIHPGNIISKKQ